MEWSELKKRKLGGKELVIAIAQDAKNKDVCMVAFQDEEPKPAKTSWRRTGIRTTARGGPSRNRIRPVIKAAGAGAAFRSGK